MDPKKRRLIIIILLLISIANYARMPYNEHIRNVEFMAIFILGMLTSLLLREIAVMVKNKWLV